MHRMAYRIFFFPDWNISRIEVEELWVKLCVFSHLLIKPVLLSPYHDTSIHFIDRRHVQCSLVTIAKLEDERMQCWVQVLPTLQPMCLTTLLEAERSTEQMGRDEENGLGTTSQRNLRGSTFSSQQLLNLATIANEQASLGPHHWGQYLWGGHVILLTCSLVLTVILSWAEQGKQDSISVMLASWPWSCLLEGGAGSQYMLTVKQVMYTWPEGASPSLIFTCNCVQNISTVENCQSYDTGLPSIMSDWINQTAE